MISIKSVIRRLIYRGKKDRGPYRDKDGSDKFINTQVIKYNKKIENRQTTQKCEKNVVILERKGYQNFLIV